MTDFNNLIGPLLVREGGYSRRIADRGGATNFGITQDTYWHWLKKQGLPWADVVGITKEDAINIYHNLYWIPANCEAIPDKLRDIHFDSAVQHGVGRAIMLLQQAAGATADGAFGPATLSAVFNIGEDLLLYRYIAARYRFYGQIVNKDRTQVANIVGWLNRMEGFA